MWMLGPLSCSHHWELLLVWVGYVVAAGKPVPEVDSLLLWWFIISEYLLHILVPVGKEYC